MIQHPQVLQALLDFDTYTSDSTITLTSPTYADTVTFHVGSDFYNKDFVDTMPAVCIKLMKCVRSILHWELFMTNPKSMYKMCEQDYKGKLKAEGLDDDIPFKEEICYIPIEELIKRINVMHDKALELHRLRNPT